MRRSYYNAPNVVLVFNKSRVLVSIFRSLHCAADLIHGNLQCISDCCNGKNVSSGGLYYRKLHPNVLIDLDDLDNLKLEEYDRLCGVKREYFSRRDMYRRRQKAIEKYKLKMLRAKEAQSNEENNHSD